MGGSRRLEDRSPELPRGEDAEEEEHRAEDQTEGGEVEHSHHIPIYIVVNSEIA